MRRCLSTMKTSLPRLRSIWIRLCPTSCSALAVVNRRQTRTSATSHKGGIHRAIGDELGVFHTTALAALLNRDER